jgi:hypothetical protein
MKKQILKLGNALSRKEQREVFGGNEPGGPRKVIGGPTGPECSTDSDCCHYPHNSSYGYLCYSGICAPGIFLENPCGL